MPPAILSYNDKQTPQDREICDVLMYEISAGMPSSEAKLWHGHPVWFLAGNPIVGYSKQKAGIRLMFWSGRAFAEPLLTPGVGRFQDASIFYNHKNEINKPALSRWLKKGHILQWDYKNIVKNRGVLNRLK